MTVCKLARRTTRLRSTRDGLHTTLQTTRDARHEAQHATDALALLGGAHRPVVLAHSFGEVPRGALRDDRLDARARS